MAKAKETKELMTESQAWSHISDLFGGSDVMLHPNELPQIETFSTTSPALDRALQIGGWARGRIYQVAGKPSSGKTFMALLAMARWQSLDPENCCCFLDLEYTYDADWAKKLGVDNDRVLLIKSNDGKKIFSGLTGTPKKNAKTGEVKNIPGLLEMIESGQTMTHKIGKREVKLNLAKMGVIVLDSIAAMQSPAEMESATGKINVAPLPRFLTTELKKLTPAIAKANVCFIAINHVKEKIGEMFGNPETTPGGAAWKHACSVMLMVAPRTGADNMLLDSNEERYGHKISIKVEKNKMGKPYKKAEFFINFTQGVDKAEEQLLDLGLIYGVINKASVRTYVINDVSLTSKEDALEYIKENRESLESAIRQKYLGGDDTFIDGEGKAEEFVDSPFEEEVEEE